VREAIAPPEIRPKAPAGPGLWRVTRPKFVILFASIRAQRAITFDQLFAANRLCNYACLFDESISQMGSEDNAVR
jgi:hypothetical protein